MNAMTFLYLDIGLPIDVRCTAFFICILGLASNMKLSRIRKVYIYNLGFLSSEFLQAKVQLYV